MNNVTTILVLYTELAGYTIASLDALARNNVKVHIVRLPINAEAPFDFSINKSISVYDRKSFDESALQKLAAEIRPNLILCSGWNDKGYLNVCKTWKSEIPVVLAMDNKWNGSARQQIARVVSRFTILSCFTHCWVPGEKQAHYARKLGFKRNKIKTGFYTCDTPLFSTIYGNQTGKKRNNFPHVFIYAGRYYEFKGVKEMWSAFARFKKDVPNDWKMISLGVGDVEPLKHPDIIHEGFVQPDRLAEVMSRSGVFILPSRFEPWAVVVQEFATAGFPLLLSNEVGAAETFLLDGKNGFSFQANDENAILAAMARITTMSDEELFEMGNKSHQLGLQNSPDRWAQTMLSFLS